MDCQKGKKKKKKKSTGTWDVFLMLQTLWGLGCDILCRRNHIEMRVRPQLFGMLSRDHLLWKVAHAEQNSMSSTGSF